MCKIVGRNIYRSIRRDRVRGLRGYITKGSFKVETNKRFMKIRSHMNMNSYHQLKIFLSRPSGDLWTDTFAEHPSRNGIGPHLFNRSCSPTKT